MCAGSIIFMLYNLFKFPHKVLIMHAGQGRNLTTISKAYEFVEDGVTKWHIQKIKSNVEVPPDQGVFLLKKLFGVGFIGMGRWDALTQSFSWFEYNRNESSVAEFNSGDISFYHAEQKKRAKYGQGLFSNPQVWAMINSGILGLVIIVAIIFAGDIMHAVVNTQNALAAPLLQAQTTQANLEIRLAQLESNIQEMPKEDRGLFIPPD